MSPSTRIVVIGGGIVAASVAYHLARQGVQVVTVEADLPGPATSAGAGIICPWTEPGDDADSYYRLSADGARYYPQLLAMLADDGQPETSYARVGTLCVAADERPLAAIAATLRARLRWRPEIGEVELVGAGEPQRRFPPLSPGLAGIWISGGARIDGRSIRDSLLRAATARGASRIVGTAVLDHRGGGVTGVRVTGVRVTGGTGGTGVLGAGERISADAVVVAAGAWTAQVCAEIGWQLPIGPQRGQILHVELPGAATESWPVILPPDDPYLLGFPAGRVVLGATREDNAGFEYRVTVGGVGAMLAAAAGIAPGLSEATLVETRVGFRPVTKDGRPLIGRLADGVFVAAGNGPEGLTAGPWTGAAAAALVLGERPPADLAPFDPARFR